MVGEMNKKRNRPSGYKRKHDRNKFRKTTNATVHRKDLGSGLKGFLFSCTPHHENQCYRDGVLLLSNFCEEVTDQENKSSDKKQQSLEEELNDLKSPQGKLFTRVEPGVTGAVFLKINNDDIDIERVVESALRDARQTGNPGSRHCIRLLPIHTTCYAKAEDAAKAAESVVKDQFPKIQDSPISYAIAFRSRLNSGAKRDDFIPAVASTVEKIEPRYKVNLSKPDVVLLVEVLKTSCCIGVFRHYYDLAKMNLREAACPSKPNEPTRQEESPGDAKEGKKENGANMQSCAEEKQNLMDSDNKGKDPDQGSEKTDSQTKQKIEQSVGDEALPQQKEGIQAEKDGTPPEEKGDDQAQADAEEQAIKESELIKKDENRSTDAADGQQIEKKR